MIEPVGLLVGYSGHSVHLVEVVGGSAAVGVRLIVVGDVEVGMEVVVGSGDEIVAVVAVENAVGYNAAFGHVVARELQVSLLPQLLPAHLGKLEVACHWKQDDWAGDAGLRTDASTAEEVACWNHSREGEER